MRLYVWETGCITQAYGAGCVVSLGANVNTARARALKAIFKLESSIPGAMDYQREAADIVRTKEPLEYGPGVAFAFDAPK